MPLTAGWHKNMTLGPALTLEAPLRMRETGTLPWPCAEPPNSKAKVIASRYCIFAPLLGGGSRFEVLCQSKPDFLEGAQNFLPSYPKTIGAQWSAASRRQQNGGQGDKRMPRSDVGGPDKDKTSPPPLPGTIKPISSNTRGVGQGGMANGRLSVFIYPS